MFDRHALEHASIEPPGRRLAIGEHAIAVEINDQFAKRVGVQRDPGGRGLFGQVSRICRHELF